MTNVALASQTNLNLEFAGLTIFDMDDTLIRSHARVHVIKSNGDHQILQEGEFKNYKLGENEKFSFIEFSSSEIFKKTSQPIEHMIEYAQQVVEHIAHRPNSKVIILTARSDFDDLELFFETLKSHGIDTDKIIIEFAGQLVDSLKIPGPQAKKKIINNYLSSGIYDRVRLFDDHSPNLEAFLELKSLYRHITFSAYLVRHDGTVVHINN